MCDSGSENRRLTRAVCGNALENDQQLIERSACNMTCDGNAEELCGGQNAINIFWNFFEPITLEYEPVMDKLKYVGCARRMFMARGVKA